MLDILLGVGFVVSFSLGGYGVKLALLNRKAAQQLDAWQRGAADKIVDLEKKVADLQAILTAAPPDMINASIVAGEWKRAMEALPEGSPRRQAFESRLKQIGAS